MPPEDPVCRRLAYALSLRVEVIELGTLGQRTCLSGETKFPGFSALR